MEVITRRSLLHGALATPWALRRADAEVTPAVVRFRPEVEPLVKLIEETPREKCAEMVVGQLRRGTSYRQLMGALFLAGVRNVNPRPPGFALHCVFIIHSAHLIGMEAPPDMRLLPLFHALDHFKSSQERDSRATTGDYTMRALSSGLPDGGRAATELTAAMESWDQDRAERAVAGLARHRSASEAFAILWRYGARDYRNIGHKAIFVANASRTLDAVGWQHAEPVLRSLVLGLLDFGREQQVNGYALEDQCYPGNIKRMREVFPLLPDGWADDRPDTDATRSMLEVLREATPDQACADAAGRLKKGQASAGAVWDAVHLAGAELNMRARGIVGIHAVTSGNGLRYAWQAASEPALRFLVLLQGVGWMAQFRTHAASRDASLRSFPITAIEPHSGDEPASKAIEEIFAGIGSKTDEAAGRVLRVSQNRVSRQAFVSEALRHTVAKADEVHYYKYLAALVEDIPLVSPEWQPHLLAAIVYYTKGSKDSEPATMKRAREAVKGLA